MSAIEIPSFLLFGAGIVLFVVFMAAISIAGEAKREREREDQGRRMLGIIRLYLHPRTNLEVFTPGVLPQGGRYRIVVRGTYRFRSWGFWYCADACYAQSSSGGNFDQPYQGIYIDSRSASPSEMDRTGHVYGFLYAATGSRASIFLQRCRGGAYDDAKLSVDIIPPKAAQSLPQSSLSVPQVLSVIPPLFQTPLSLCEVQRLEQERQAQAKADRERLAQEAARQAEEQARLRAEMERRREEARKQRKAREEQLRAEEQRRRQEEEARRAHLQEVATGLRIRAALEQNWLSPGYRKNLAEHHTDEVLKHKHEFGSIYYQIHSSPELLALITADARVLDWIAGWHDTILRAERVEALPPPRTEPAPQPPALPPRPERRRFTEAEVRARIQHRIMRGGRDKIADRLAKDALLREYAEKLAEEYPEMDEDEREKRVNEFALELMEQENNDGTKIQ